MHIFIYKCVLLQKITDKLHSHRTHWYAPENLQWLVIWFEYATLFLEGGHIYLSRITGGQLHTCFFSIFLPIAPVDIVFKCLRYILSAPGSIRIMQILSMVHYFSFLCFSPLQVDKMECYNTPLVGNFLRFCCSILLCPPWTKYRKDIHSK